MGSACCIAARDRTLPNRTSSETLRRDILYSPSWSSRWDNRRRVAGEVENSMIRFSHGIGWNAGLEIKGGVDVETGDALDVGNPLDNSQTSTWQRSPIHEETAENLKTCAADLSLASDFSTGIKGLTKSPALADPSPSYVSLSMPSTSSLSTPKKDSLSFKDHPLPADSTPSKQSWHSPGHQLLRQVSDGQIPGSSDIWSMHTFSELVASSQRERWSFDSGSFGSGHHGKITRTSSSQLSNSLPVDLQICGVCSKFVKERSSWSNKKVFTGYELSVVAVLVCGHAYHAECLENATAKTDRYDPACPVCVDGEKQGLKMSRKGWRAGADMMIARNNKIPKNRNRVVDSDFNGGCAVFDHQKNAGREGNGSKMWPSSSFRSSFARPFLRRHFSLESKSTRSLSENDSCRKNGFWARHHKM